MKKQLFFQLKSGLPWFGGGMLLAVLFAFSFIETRPKCAIGVEKTNVFYMGVDNPIVIQVRGVPKEQVEIKTENISLESSGYDRYNVRVKNLGEAKITVSGGDLKPTEFKFRVKKFPDPIMCIGRRQGGGTMSRGEFCAQGGISAVMNGLDICGNCETISYEVTRYTEGQDPVTKFNTGARFNGDAASLIQLAKPGDTYFFERMKARCPGDVVHRDMRSMKVTIK